MKNKKTEVGPKSYEELIGSMETRETAAAENPQDGRFTEAATLREWKKLLKEKSLVQILEDGIGEQSVGSPSICRLAADENWMASERECDAHLDALRAISKKPELAKEVRDQIHHHVFELDDEINGAMQHAAEGMFNLLVSFFLPRVPYPFAGLGLFPESERKGGAR